MEINQDEKNKKSIEKEINDYTLLMTLTAADEIIRTVNRIKVEICLRTTEIIKEPR